jgi:hypothetical protein
MLHSRHHLREGRCRDDRRSSGTHHGHGHGHGRGLEIDRDGVPSYFPRCGLSPVSFVAHCAFPLALFSSCVLFLVSSHFLHSPSGPHPLHFMLKFGSSLSLPVASALFALSSAL